MNKSEDNFKQRINLKQNKIHENFKRIYDYSFCLKGKIISCWKPFLIIFSLYFIASIALFRANYYYIDDMGRSIEGYRGWYACSRYLSEYLSIFLHANKVLSDISPLTQIIALFIMSIASLIVIYSITGQIKISFSIIAVLPLGLSPYFLECLSYKFDSPYMAISVLAAVFPVLFISKNQFLFFIVSVISTIAVCTSYQSATGIFPMLMIMLCFLAWNRGEALKNIFKTIFVSALGYGSGLLLFRFFIMKNIPPESSYVSADVLPFPEIITEGIQHYKKYFGLIWSDYNPLWLALIIILIAIFIIGSVFQSKRCKIVSLFLSSCAVIGMLLFSFGLCPFFTKYLVEPRAMYGFGAYIAMISVCAVSRPRAILSKIVALMLSWCFIVFASVYGNVLSVQEDYSDFRTEVLIDDLKDMDIFTSKNDPVIYDIDGPLGIAPQLNVTFSQYPVLNRLVYPSFGGKRWYWSRCAFQNCYSIPNLASFEDLSSENLPLLKDTMYHSIYGRDNMIRIVLK